MHDGYTRHLPDNRVMHEPRQHIVWALIAVLGLLSAACDSRAPSQAKASAASGTDANQAAQAGPATSDKGAQSPAETAVLLGRYHRERDYGRIEALIVADRRAETMAFLRAVDRVLDANVRLRRAADKRFGSLLANAWNLSTMENNLGVFSAETRLINQRFRGNGAIVTMQEAENVPLVRAAFECCDGVWQLRPEPLTQAVLPELEKLAHVLSDVGAELEAGEPFEFYVEAFFERVLPQMSRVVTVKDGPIRVTDAAEATRP